MSTRVPHLAVAVFLMALANSASAGLVAHWPFNNSPNDQVGALHWALNAGATYSTDRKEGSHAVQFDGVDDYASLAGAGLMANAFTAKTVMLWFKPNATAGTQVLYDEGGYTNGIGIRINNGLIEGAVQNSQAMFIASGPLSGTGWSHVAITFDNGDFRLYLNGAEVASLMATFTQVPSHTNVAGLGARNGQDAFDGGTSGDFYAGLIDDVRMYDEALPQTEIGEMMLGRPRAWNPSPADGVEAVNSPLFTWTPGGTAQWHNLYLGTDPNLGAEDLVAPQQVFPMYWHAPGLQPGATYYWRVDAVEADGTVWTGPVWSFEYASLEAYKASPADGAKHLEPDVELTWQQGLNGVSHDVYFGADAAAVAEGTGDTFKGNVFVKSFKTGPLQAGTTYYWRIDEVGATGEKVKGHVWSFRTIESIPIGNPNLVARWTLDEGLGRRVVDWSGHGHHGNFVGDLQWADGYDGSALQLPGVAGNRVEMPGYEGVLGKQDRTCTAWIKTAGLGAILSWGQAVSGQKWIFRVQDSNGNAGAIRIEVESGRIVGWTDLRDNEWHHVAAVLESAGAPSVSNISFYVDGQSEAISDSLAVDIDTVGGGRNVWIGDDHSSRGFPGLLDDIRIYDKALSREELDNVMRIDPLRAWQPSPASGSVVDIRTAAPLTWTKGDSASKHNVYLGAEAAAVAAAEATDTTGVFRSQISATNFTPAEDLEWGKQYFWRVDEVNADGTVTPGRVWSFTVADYLIVDDFETYTDEDGSRIYQTWIDGWTNSTGSTVGNVVAPFAERTIVFSGKQAMPLDYNNVNSPYYSEAELELSAAQDWTFGGADTLVVHFRGQPVSFLESAGTITVSAAGTDIWNTADEFRFVWKRLDGDGSIVARVDSITNTNVWAKGGVMIRETLEPGSRHAMVVVTPGSGVAFQRRQTNDAASVGTTQTGIMAPRWLKVTRQGNTLTAQHSADGVTWTDVTAAGATSSDTVVMGTSVYIGLALTSHAAGVAGTAQFSEVKTTGNVTGVWQPADIGVAHPGNGPAGLYVAVEDSTGKTAVISHPDPAAATIGAWTPWAIPLSDLTGVNATRVKKLYIGVGDRNSPKPAGAGRVYLDDIRISRGAPAAP